MPDGPSDRCLCRIDHHRSDTDRHEWREPLTSLASDEGNQFNRAEYLRCVPINDPDFDRMYGMRADAESLNAQLEHAFHKQRIPALGVPNTTAILLFAVLARNAWARAVWNRQQGSETHAPQPLPDLTPSQPVPPTHAPRVHAELRLGLGLAVGRKPSSWRTQRHATVPRRRNVGDLRDLQITATRDPHDILSVKFRPSA